MPNTKQQSPAIRALLSRVTPEEIETGILQRERPAGDSKSWTPEEIRQAVQAESVPVLLKRARTIRKQSMATVASVVGVSRGRISQLETEGANLELATLAKVAHALGYDLQVQLVPKSGDGETLTATL